MADRTVHSENITDGYADAIRFLAALFDQAPGDHFLDIRQINREGKVTKNFHSFELLQTDGFGKALPIKSDGLCNVYYGVAPRITRRGKARDVRVAGAVWFDEITRVCADQ